MDHNIPETWIRSGPVRDTLEAALRQEGDHDTRRRVWLTEDVRGQVAVAQGNSRAASEVLAELFPSLLSGINPSSEQAGPTEAGSPARDSCGNDFQFAHDSVDRAKAIRSSGIRQPTEPRQRFMQVDSSWLGENNAFSREEQVGLLATRGGQARRGRGISTAELLAQYGTTSPVAFPETKPHIGDEHIRELLPEQTGAGDDFKETWGIAQRRIHSSKAGGGEGGKLRGWIELRLK